PDPFLSQTASLTPSPEPFTAMPCFLLGNLMDLPKIYRALGLNIKNVLVSRESVISHLPLNIGDQVEVRTFLTNVYEQQASGNPIGFVILEYIGRVAHNVAFVGERI